LRPVHLACAFAGPTAGTALRGSPLRWTPVTRRAVTPSSR
jgi:hypothetical protein